MLTVSGLVDLMTNVRVEEFSVLRMISRRLIDAEILPKAVGARIPHVTHEQAALFLLAVMATTSVYRDAPRNAQTYGALVKEGIGASTALDAVVYLLRTLPTDPLALEWSLEVCVTFPQVVLKNRTIHAGHPSHSERTDAGDLFIPKGEDRAMWPADSLKRNATLSGACIYAIACALADDQ